MNTDAESEASEKRLPNWVRQFLVLGLAPGLAYAAFFFALTWPASSYFATHFLTDAGDGLQNVWNLWWVDHAVTQLHQTPFHTKHLHYPYGTTLYGHTLNPFNGFLAIPLLRVFSLTVTHNLIVLFSFVMGGLGVFWLARERIKNWFPSFVAGYLFTFSSYHFAHAQGHLQLVALEWIPIYLLFWLRMLDQPNRKYAALAAVSLFLVILCDYYYFFYCVMASVILLIGLTLRERSIRYIWSDGRPGAFAWFVLLSLCTSGLIIRGFLMANLADPFQGGHEVKYFSLDLYGLVLPGNLWRYTGLYNKLVPTGHFEYIDLTLTTWSLWPDNTPEKNSNIGMAVIVLIVLSVRRSREVHNEFRSGLWFTLLLIFYLFALGPRLQAFGYEFENFPMPYELLETLIPMLKVSGVPARMAVMCSLASALLVAAALKAFYVDAAGKMRYAHPTLVIFLTLAGFEMLPSELPVLQIPTPEHIVLLTELDEGEPIIDDAGIRLPSLALYYQTIHERPMALGYIARFPKSVSLQYSKVRAAFEERECGELTDTYGYRYMIVPYPLQDEKCPDAELIYSHDRNYIYMYDFKSAD